MKYRMEICKPGDIAKSDGVAALFESDVPFGTVSVGDLLNSGFWGENALAGQDDGWSLLRVVGIEHILSSRHGEIIHHAMIHTEAVPDTYETRYPS